MHLKQASDIQLWQCCQQDDMRAYNELFDRYFPKLYRLSLHYIKDTGTAEELAMDLLCKFWYKRHQLDINDLSAYLFRSMKNYIINQLKKNIPETIDLDHVHEDQIVSDNNTDATLMLSDVENIYQECLAGLSTQRRRAFQLSREQNLTYSEIAQEMNISVSAVENYIGAALNSLRKGMKEYTTTSILLIIFHTSYILACFL